MTNSKKSHWIFSWLNGFLAILFGLIAIFYPFSTLIALALYFAISILVGGFVLIAGAIKRRFINPNWNLILLEGIISVVLGFIILFNPKISAAVLVTFIGFWAIIVGSIFIISYYRNKQPIAGRGIFLLSGILSVLFGLLIAFNPFEGSRVITVLIGFYMISYGLFSVITKNRKSNVF